MTRLRAAFERTRSENRAALVPYLTAGDPSLSATVDFAQALADGGADLLEIGLPFSDPLADGPVIQRATERALGAGTRVPDVLACASEIRERVGIPVILMSYANPLLRYGWERFAGDAADAGVVGIILTDVPPEEAGAFLPAAAEADLGTVFLVAPTSHRERIRRAVEATTGFLYCVSRMGITGERESLSLSFRPVLDAVREMSDVPVGLGFGISRAEHAREAGALADGVIVGSALVAIVEKAASHERAIASLKATAWDFRRALREARRS